MVQMCEDNPEQLDSQIPGLPERPINAFMPRLLLVRPIQGLFPPLHCA